MMLLLVTASASIFDMFAFARSHALSISDFLRVSFH